MALQNELEELKVHCEDLEDRVRGEESERIAERTALLTELRRTAEGLGRRTAGTVSRGAHGNSGVVGRRSGIGNGDEEQL